MSYLQEIYASSSSANADAIIRTLELTCPSWNAPVLICNGFNDQLCLSETGEAKAFVAANIGIALPKVNNKGNQAIAFSVDNTTGEVQQKTDLALDANDRVTAIYRTYLESNKLAPSEKPYRLTVQGGSIQGNVAQIQCGYFDPIGVGWPRDAYTPDFVPGIRWV